MAAAGLSGFICAVRVVGFCGGRSGAADWCAVLEWLVWLVDLFV